MSKFIKSAVMLFFILFCLSPRCIMAEGKGAELDIPVEADSELSYGTDFEGNTLGASDYYVSQDDVYVLSNLKNTIFRFRNNTKTGEFCFDKTGKTVIRFAAEGDSFWTYDNCGDITFYEGTERKAVLSLYSLIRSEAIQDFYLYDHKLYVVVMDPKPEEKLDFVTFILSLRPDGSIGCEKTVRGRIYDGENIEDPAEIRRILEKDAQKISREEGYTFVCQDGVEDLGPDEEGGHYYFSLETIQDSEKEYSLQRVYHYDSKKELAAVYNVPVMVPSCGFMTKWFDHKVYLLETEADSVRVKPVEKIAEKHELSEALVNMGASNTEKEPENAETEASAADLSSLILRATAIANAQSYNSSSFSWSCSAANLTPGLNYWRKPRYISGAGTYTAMPYCFGGFDTIQLFNSGVQNGKHIGNLIYDSDSSSYLNQAAHLYDIGYTCGMDCSGYVCRALNMGSHYTTSALSNVCTGIAWSSLLPADLINKAGSHVMMYYTTASNGYLMVYECTTSGSYDRVVQLNHYKNYLAQEGYVPLKYNYIVN